MTKDGFKLHDQITTLERDIADLEEMLAYGVWGSGLPQNESMTDIVNQLDALKTKRDKLLDKLLEKTNG